MLIFQTLKTQNFDKFWPLIILNNQNLTNVEKFEQNLAFKTL